jgi:hypothetical protein
MKHLKKDITLRSLRSHELDPTPKVILRRKVTATQYLPPYPTRPPLKNPGKKRKKTTQKAIFNANQSHAVPLLTPPP